MLSAFPYFLSFFQPLSNVHILIKITSIDNLSCLKRKLKENFCYFYICLSKKNLVFRSVLTVIVCIMVQFYKYCSWLLGHFSFLIAFWFVSCFFTITIADTAWHLSIFKPTFTQPPSHQFLPFYYCFTDQSFPNNNGLFDKYTQKHTFECSFPHIFQNIFVQS